VRRSERERKPRAVQHQAHQNPRRPTIFETVSYVLLLAIKPSEVILY
jgi:hypothetical protein